MVICSFNLVTSINRLCKARRSFSAFVRFSFASSGIITSKCLTFLSNEELYDVTNAKIAETIKTSPNRQENL